MKSLESGTQEPHGPGSPGVRAFWRWDSFGHCLVTAMLVQFSFAALWFNSGCSSTTSGYRISDETVAFIQPGVTSRAELLENLGPPLLTLPDLGVVAYSWGKVRLTGARQPVQGGVNPSFGGSHGSMPAAPGEPGQVESRRWLYCIALDLNDRVTRHGTMELTGASSLEKAVREWAERTGP
jgi:hypothetical protein